MKQFHYWAPRLRQRGVVRAVLQQRPPVGLLGDRYDEMIVCSIALGRRHAHIFPRLEEVRPHMQEALPEFEQEKASSLHMAFCNIFSDHLAVFVDAKATAHGRKIVRRTSGNCPIP